jgi:membrane fusion protein (multidrug efflux system)
VVLAIASGVISLAGRSPDGGQEPSKPKKGPTVRVEAARKAPISRTLELTGEVVPVNSVVVAVTVEGPIRFCPWREGHRVGKGEKLIEIDRETYRAEVQAAQAALAVAEAKLADMKAGTRPEEIREAEQQVREWEATLARAKTGFDRAKRLVEPGAISQEDFEKSQTDFDAIHAKLAAATARLERLRAGATRTAIAVQEAVVGEAAAGLELAKARLAECVVTAPFDGTVAAVHVRAGDVATAKAPLLEIVDLSSLVVRFAVPESYATSIRPGTPVTVILDAYPGQTHRAVIVRVYPTLDPTMRTRTVEAEMADPLSLVPGMFARLEVELERAADAIVVAQEAILVTPNGQKQLFVIHDGKAQQRKITTGIERGRMVQVLEGVEPGEQVVVAGNEKLKDGISVTLPGAGGGGPGSTEKPVPAGAKSASAGGPQT